MGGNNKSVAEPLKRSPAVAQGRVYKINDDHLISPGPRAVDGLEEMARGLHPEAFKMISSAQIPKMLSGIKVPRHDAKDCYRLCGILSFVLLVIIVVTALHWESSGCR